MRFSLGCLAASLVAMQAFQLPLSTCYRSSLVLSSNYNEANHYYNHDDEDPNPLNMRVEEIKAELDALNCNYSDCFNRNQLEQRLVQARYDPRNYSNNPSSSGQIFGEYEAPPNQVGMRSTETKFEGLQQNIYAAPKKKKTVFFGELDDTTNTIETERGGKKEPTPPSSSSGGNSPTITTSYRSTTSGGGQSLYGSGEEATRASDYQPTTPPKRQTIFGADNNDLNLDEGSSRNTNTNVYGSNRPTQDTNRWSTFEGIKIESGGKQQTKTNQPSNIPNRWSTFEGIRTETPNNSGIHLEPPNARNQRLKAEPRKEPNQQETRQQPNTPFQNLNLEPPARKQYKRSIDSEKQKYNTIRDFSFDQEAPRTKFYHGIQVEDAPGRGAQRRPTGNTAQHQYYNEKQPNRSNPSHGGDPMQSDYEGFWKETVEGNDGSSSSNNPREDDGSFPGSMDMDNRF